MDKPLRPREKAAQSGLESCTDLELLCLVIGSGTRQKDVHTIAAELLEKTENLALLTDMAPLALQKTEGIGTAKALSICAAVEIVKRALKARACSRTFSVHNPKDVVEWMQAEIGWKDQEYFVALYLDGAGQVISRKVLFVGSASCSVVAPGEIFKQGYLHSALGVLIVHNHPSNNPRPSKADIESTAKIARAGEVAGIEVIDHIIVGADTYFSFRAAGLLD